MRLLCWLKTSVLFHPNFREQNCFAVQTADLAAARGHGPTWPSEQLPWPLLFLNLDSLDASYVSGQHSLHPPWTYSCSAYSGLQFVLHTHRGQQRTIQVQHAQAEVHAFWTGVPSTLGGAVVHTHSLPSVPCHFLLWKILQQGREADCTGAESSPTCSMKLCWVLFCSRSWKTGYTQSSEGWIPSKPGCACSSSLRADAIADVGGTDGQQLCPPGLCHRLVATVCPWSHAN